jgi:ATP-dependent Clp protease adaptor protein ClpS
MSFSNSKTELEEEVISLEDLIGTYNIILYNDDVNTFDWVIDSLVDLCDHLKPICEALLDRGLSAKLED